MKLTMGKHCHGTGVPATSAEPLRPDAGFSMIELMITMAVLLVLSAIALPALNTINTVTLRNKAVAFSGLVQAARMQAVRKNSFYSIVAQTSGNNTAYFVDLQKNQTWASGDATVELGNVSVYAGTGGSAPQASSFTTSLGFNFNTGLPTMDARGLPCSPSVSGTTCPETPGSGFVVFFSNNNYTGGVNWAALVVTPAGRAQVWSYSGGSSGTWSVW